MAILLGLLAAALFAFAGTRHAPLQVRRAGTGTPADALAQAPPLVAFTTVALGGFRGLLSDVLWLRATHLQEQGRYFELLQLADWITKLQPHCSEVWTFHAWNMAYNVGGVMTEPDDRWRWLRNGISLLQVQGLRYNPGDPDLYFEIGWLFLNKIGQNTDPAHMDFKRRWAAEMTGLLGGARPNYGAMEADPVAVRRLWENCRLTPTQMRMLEAAYGPLDWRLPQSHAAYWAWLGTRRDHRSGANACDRLLFQALMALFLEGRLDFAPAEGRFVTTPDLDRLPGVIRAFEAAMERHRSPSMRVAYHNFLREAVLVLYVFGRTADAQRALDRLRQVSPSGDVPLEAAAFAERNLIEAAARANKARLVAFVEGFLYQASVCGATGAPERAAQAEAMAQRLWDGYTHGRSPEVLARVGIPEFDDLRRLARARALADLQAPSRTRPAPPRQPSAPRAWPEDGRQP